MDWLNSGMFAQHRYGYGTIVLLAIVDRLAMFFVVIIMQLNEVMWLQNIYCRFPGATTSIQRKLSHSLDVSHALKVWAFCKCQADCFTIKTQMLCCLYFRCELPPSVLNGTTDIYINNETLLDMYIPRQEDGSYDSCKKYITPKLSTDNGSASPNATQCDNWVYDTTEMKTTIVSQVCKCAIYPMWLLPPPCGVGRTIIDDDGLTMGESRSGRSRK